MLGWLRPRCPLATGGKMWIEFRMRWLAGKLGIDRLIGSEVILPEPRYFPDPYNRAPEDARRIFDRVCGYMKLDPDKFVLEIVPDDSIPGAAGLYYQEERPRIVLAESRLSDPERLVAAISHELAHEILLGGGLITVQEEDHEPLTDLLPVFLGLGVFTANAPVRDRSHFQNHMHHFKIDFQGYLPSHVLGYALALFAYARGETRPAWARYLRLDAAEPFKAGLRYVLKTGDSLFHPETAQQPVEPPTEAQVIERLRTGSPTVRAMTLHDVANLESPPITLIGAVVSRLRDRDIDVRIEAARALPGFGEAAGAAVPELIPCLTSSSAALRTVAAAALPAIGGPAELVVPELTRLLEDPDTYVAETAADGLRGLAPSAASAVPALLEAIRKREVDCHSSDALADALIAIDPPPAALQRLLDPIDPETPRLMIRSLRAARFRRLSDRPPSPAIDPP